MDKVEVEEATRFSKQNANIHIFRLHICTGKLKNESNQKCLLNIKTVEKWLLLRQAW